MQVVHEGEPLNMEEIEAAGHRLAAAAEAGDWQLVKEMAAASTTNRAAAVAVCGPIGIRGLQAAAEHGQADVVNVLLAAGNSVDIWDAGMWDFDTWQPYIWDAELDRDVYFSLLRRGPAAVVNAAVRGGSAEAVRLLCAARAPINYADEDTGETPLYVSLFRGYWYEPRLLEDINVDVVRALLECGADPNADAPMDYEHYDGFDVLCWAAMEDNAHIVNVLVEAGADLSGPQFSLHVAAANGSLATVKALLAAGADPNYAITRVGEGPWTPLHYLVWDTDGGCGGSHNFAGVPEVVRALMEGGADPWAKDGEGRTALDLIEKEIWGWSSEEEAAGKVLGEDQQFLREQEIASALRAAMDAALEEGAV